ncbi:MAG TPA: LysM peptidoglycan-binding domain-containing protein, partial [Rhodanobacteraceae bacterium]|nr:LysM peptidoglycan-binding domain-containing protein [Rhodanobacteraceae bacterium]
HLAPIAPWSRIRDRFAMTGCDYRPQVMRWAKRYTASPRRFEASWERALPFVLIVVDELERRNLPGEFAMLPFVESGYEPVAARGDRPAGMWQIDADTARGEGLLITADYDGRLDAALSTTAALSLIERYQKEFGDWRLADMAFNSGEYRVKRLLRGRDAHSLSAGELGKLAFNPITHDHLDRLLALSCIVEDPGKFGVELPEPSAEDRLETVALESGMDVRLAARLAGMDPADLKRFNAGYRRNRMAASAPHRLVMPADRVERFRAAAQGIPVALWNDWREERAARTSGLASWAAEVGIPVAVLAAANAIGSDRTVGPTTRLLLPGREPEPREPDARSSRRNVHVVKSGDTLSSIAHRYDLSIAELKRLNPKAHALLHPGDTLRVEAAGAD